MYKSQWSTNRPKVEKQTQMERIVQNVNKWTKIDLTGQKKN